MGFRLRVEESLLESLLEGRRSEVLAEREVERVLVMTHKSRCFVHTSQHGICF